MRKIWRILFSRYTISALLILFQVSVMIFINYRIAELSAAAAAILLCFSAAGFLHLINSDANPEYKLSWAAVMLVFPIAGLTLYTLFYSRRLTRSEERRIKDITKKLRSCGKGGSLSLVNELAKENACAAGQAYSILSDDALAAVYKNTSSTYFSDGENMLRSMLRDLESAGKYILLEYFIIDEGWVLSELLSVLRRKRDEGVKIKMLYDDVGCMKTLPRDFDKSLRAEGIECYRFGRVTPRVSTVHNNRNHRKILVVDGKVAYTGGMNLADEYVNKIHRFGHWRDGGVRLEGDAAEGLTKAFLQDFSLSRGEDEDFSEYFPDHSHEGDGGYYVPFGCGPAPLYRHSVGKRAIMNVINRAERYLYVTTPYLIIDFDLTEALRSAAMRGVDVRIVTPGIPDKRIIKIMTEGSYPALIEAGVRIFEYSPGFIHEKTIVSDDTAAIIGTINLDYRSLAHHFENAVMIIGSPELPRIRDGVLRAISDGREITAIDARLSLPKRIVKTLVRIFAPLL